MWRELAGRLYSDAQFAAPASSAEIDQIGLRLGNSTSARSRCIACGDQIDREPSLFSMRRRT
jgi:hypothetical protein